MGLVLGGGISLVSDCVDSVRRICRMVSDCIDIIKFDL